MTMTRRKTYQFDHMFNRALFRVRTLIKLAQLDPRGHEREVSRLALFYRDGYPTGDADLVDRDAESVVHLWLTEHFKRIHARLDEEEGNQ